VLARVARQQRRDRPRAVAEDRRQPAAVGSTSSRNERCGRPPSRARPRARKWKSACPCLLSCCERTAPERRHGAAGAAGVRGAAGRRAAAAPHVRGRALPFARQVDVGESAGGVEQRPGVERRASASARSGLTGRGARFGCTASFAHSRRRRERDGMAVQHASSAFRPCAAAPQLHNEKRAQRGHPVDDPPLEPRALRAGRPVGQQRLALVELGVRGALELALEAGRESGREPRRAREQPRRKAAGRSA